MNQGFRSVARAGWGGRRRTAGRRVLWLVALVWLLTPARGQWRAQDSRAAADSLALPRFEPHLFVGAGVIAASGGGGRMLYHAAPSFVVRPSDRLTIHAGFDIRTDMGLGGGYDLGPTPRSLAPYRSCGTRLISGGAGVAYRAGRDVWLWGAVSHIGGTYAPFFGPASGSVVNVSATALSAAAAFRFADDNYLHLSFTYVRDHAGTLGSLWYDAWRGGYGYGGGAWGTYATPFDYYRMAAPCAPSGGGWRCP